MRANVHEWKSTWAQWIWLSLMRKWTYMLESHGGKWGATRRETRWRQIAPRHHGNRKATWQWLCWASRRCTAAVGTESQSWKVMWVGKREKRRGRKVGRGGMNHIFVFVLLIQLCRDAHTYGCIQWLKYKTCKYKQYGGVLLTFRQAIQMLVWN